MTDRLETNSSFDCTSRFSFPRTTLPDKIIRLRKISQENHVRRMKLAYKMKEMNGLLDISSCLSPSFPRKRFSSSKSSHITPATVQSCTGNIQSRKTDLFQLLPAKINSDSSKGNSARKSTSVKIVKKKLFCNESKTNFSGGDFSHSLNKTKTVTKSNNCLENKLQNEINTFSIGKKESFLSKNKIENDRIDKVLLQKTSPNIVIDRNDPSEEKKRKNVVAKKTPSKIPVLKSRLKMKNNSKESKSLNMENSNDVPEESLESMLKEVENQFKEFNLRETDEKELEDVRLEESYTLPQLVCHCCEDDACRSLYNTFREDEESHDDMSFMDKWMNNVVDTTDKRKSSSESSPTSKNMHMVRTSTSQENNSLVSERKNKTENYVHIDKSSGISAKCDYITDITDSDESSGTYYGVDEIAYESRRKTRDTSKWNDVNFEAASTITVPSDKDLEVADHRDPIFKSLPDYPNTPYNLRYPRFRFKGYDDIYSSLDIEYPNSTSRVKSYKNRRKCYSATPKRVISSKKKKTKKQILRKKDT